MDGLECLVSLLEIMVIIFVASSFLILYSREKIVADKCLCTDVFQVIFAPSLKRGFKKQIM